MHVLFCFNSKTVVRSGAEGEAKFVLDEDSPVEHADDEKEENLICAGKGSVGGGDESSGALQNAQEAEAIGHDDEAVYSYLLAGNHKKVVCVFVCV